MALNRRLFLRALVGVAVAAPALTRVIAASKPKEEPLKMDHVVSTSSTTGRIICFNVHCKEIMSIGPNGMRYKGALIEDAGEAHRAFLEVMDMMNRQGVTHGS